MPHGKAERYALAAIPMNRGLAELTGIERPAWSSLLPRAPEPDVRSLAAELWAQANAQADASELPIALRVIDHCENDFIEFECSLVAARRPCSQFFRVESGIRKACEKRFCDICKASRIAFTSGNATVVTRITGTTSPLAWSTAWFILSINSFPNLLMLYLYVLLARV
jgi:hypothetical protein